MIEWWWFVVGVVALVGVLLLVLTLPDIARYMRMRRM